jgi:GTP cyclohydrolase I
MNYACAHDDEFDPDNPLGKPDVPEKVQDAIRTLLEWAGDDPAREGLRDTPKRVGRAWLEYCEGYKQDPAIHLSRQFTEVGGYDEIVLLKDIPFQSHCEHHLAPITGKAAIAYLPNKKVVGISKLARVLNGFAHRLQIQERLTAEVAQCIWDKSRAARRGRGDRGAARLHDRARGQDPRRGDGHEPDPRLFSG